eukprot:359524-Prorocentrum_minimum.AAC.2
MTRPLMRSENASVCRGGEFQGEEGEFQGLGGEFAIRSAGQAKTEKRRAGYVERRTHVRSGSARCREGGNA